MLVQSDIDNTETLLGSELTHLRTQKPAWYSFPRLMKTIASYDTAVNPVINIVGFGSSVGVGATLPDPATQAPVAVFSSTLKSVIDPGNIYNFVTYNDCVNGSTISQAAAALDAAVAAGHTPNICVLAYGMNDGAVAIFNSGQTYPSVYSSIMQFVTKARGYGADVVLMTTPHVNTDIYVYEMPSVIPQNYPTFVAAPVLPTQLIPPAAASNITADWLGTGQNITVAHRHYRVNQAMRQAATDAGIAVIDVERYWFKAVAKFGVAALFNPGETVHPNLLGHQNSYWLAIYEFLQAMGWQTGQEGQEARLNGLIGINNASPQAVLDVIPPYPNVTTPPLQVSARVGQTDGAGVKAATVVWKIDPSNGDLVGYAAKTTDSTLIEVYRHNYTMDGTGTTVATLDVTEKYKSSSSRVRYSGVYNVNGAQTLMTLPDNSTGTIYVNALNNGIGMQRSRVEWISLSGVVTFGTIENVGAAVFTGPTAAGLIAQIAVVAAATNVTWQIVINSGF
jgi:lysophospholipase L1-like esterase